MINNIKWILRWHVWGRWLFLDLANGNSFSPTHISSSVSFSLELHQHDILWYDKLWAVEFAALPFMTRGASWAPSDNGGSGAPPMYWNNNNKPLEHLLHLKRRKQETQADRETLAKTHVQYQSNISWQTWLKTWNLILNVFRVLSFEYQDCVSSLKQREVQPFVSILKH